MMHSFDNIFYYTFILNLKHIFFSPVTFFLFRISHLSEYYEIKEEQSRDLYCIALVRGDVCVSQQNIDDKIFEFFFKKIVGNRVVIYA